MPFEQVWPPSRIRDLFLACSHNLWGGGVQYQEDWYPPFACGCGFVLSSDLVEYLMVSARVPAMWYQPGMTNTHLRGVHVRACVRC
jgi:hypothetical protein